MNESLALISWLLLMLMVMLDYFFGFIKGSPLMKKRVFNWLIVLTALSVGTTGIFTNRACKPAVSDFVVYPMVILAVLFTIVHMYKRVKFCDSCGAATYLTHGWPSFVKGAFFTDLEDAKREKSICWNCKAKMTYQ